MALIFSYQLLTNVWFRVSVKPSRLMYPVTDTVALEHPLLRARSSFEDGGMLAVPGDQVWFGTNCLTLHIAGDLDPSDYSVLDRVLSRLRRLSRQAHMPRDIASLTYSTADEPPPEDALVKLQAMQREREQEGYRTMVNKLLYTTAIRDEHLDALSNDTGDRDPLHEDLLLDAIEALAGRNYRSAIVYAAFAAEAAASTMLTIAMADAIRDKPAHLRVIERPNAGGTTSVKDPVYEVLRKRDNFKALLHERPLYLVRRSLLVEREALYQNLDKLYRTRNAIVHSSDKSETFDVDSPSAEICIRLVIELLKWLGLPHDFTIPGGVVDPRTGLDVTFGASR